MGYLRRKLASRKERCETRYDYYEMKNQMVDISSVIPPEFRWLKECLGWCSKAVDSIPLLNFLMIISICKRYTT